MTNRTFGKYIRRHRKLAELTLGDLGDLLGCSAAYISDVELGKKPPFTDDKLQRVSELLRVPLPELRQLALLYRGVHLETNSASSDSREMALALARTWENLDDNASREIMTILRRYET